MSKRMWIVGNGPSLANTPMDMLCGEDCFAMNRIFLIYPQTKWRPTHYLKLDHKSEHKQFWTQEVHANLELGIPCYLWAPFKDGHPETHPNHEDLPYGIGDHPNAIWIDRCEKHHYYTAGNSKAPSSWHLPELCTFGNKLSTMMQIAVLLGYEELYLIGCDLGYSEDLSKNHFKQDYLTNVNYGEGQAKFDELNVRTSHEIAYHSSPVPIYNATLGGSLEVYPRVDFYEVLKQ